MITDRMLRDTQRTVRLPVIYSRLCLLWLVYFQALFVVCLWDIIVDWPELFGSRALDAMLIPLCKIRDIGWISLFLAGVFLVALYAIRERRLKPNTVWVLSGIAYLILAMVGGILIMISSPEEPSLPSTHQFVWIGLVIALDIIVLVGIRRFIRSRATNADATAN